METRRRSGRQTRSPNKSERSLNLTRRNNAFQFRKINADPPIARLLAPPCPLHPPGQASAYKDVEVAEGGWRRRAHRGEGVEIGVRGRDPDQQSREPGKPGISVPDTRSTSSTTVRKFPIAAERRCPLGAALIPSPVIPAALFRAFRISSLPPPSLAPHTATSGEAAGGDADGGLDTQRRCATWPGG